MSCFKLTSFFTVGLKEDPTNVWPVCPTLEACSELDGSRVFITLNLAVRSTAWVECAFNIFLLSRDLVAAKQRSQIIITPDVLPQTGPGSQGCHGINNAQIFIRQVAGTSIEGLMLHLVNQSAGVFGRLHSTKQRTQIRCSELVYFTMMSIFFFASAYQGGCSTATTAPFLEKVCFERS